MEGRLDNAVRGRLRLRHLDLLVGLNNTGSLHKVAARLSMTQSAAIRWASSILRSVGDSLTEVKLVRDDAQGRVRVGVFPPPFQCCLARH